MHKPHRSHMGETQDFASLHTAIKYDRDKLRFDLLPAGPLMEIARVFTYGAGKYCDRNWEKGMDWGRLFAATQRHLWAFWAGEDIDPESGISHLAHAGFGVLALLEFTKTHPELDDRANNFSNKKRA